MKNVSCNVPKADNFMIIFNKCITSNSCVNKQCLGMMQQTFDISQGENKQTVNIRRTANIQLIIRWMATFLGVTIVVYWIG